MKKAYIILVVFTLTIFMILFFQKNELSFDLVCKLDNADNEFYPDAYVVINSEQKLRDFVYTYNNIKKCSDSFNLSKYSYVVVFGKKAKLMYYSYKSTYFDDKSAPYARHSGDDVLFIDYENVSNDGQGIYVYRIEKNEKLRGFYGI